MNTSGKLRRAGDPIATPLLLESGVLHGVMNANRPGMARVGLVSETEFAIGISLYTGRIRGNPMINMWTAVTLSKLRVTVKEGGNGESSQRMAKVGR